MSHLDPIHPPFILPRDFNPHPPPPAQAPLYLRPLAEGNALCLGKILLFISIYYAILIFEFDVCTAALLDLRSNTDENQYN